MRPPPASRRGNVALVELCGDGIEARGAGLLDLSDDRQHVGRKPPRSKSSAPPKQDRRRRTGWLALTFLPLLIGAWLGPHSLVVRDASSSCRFSMIGPSCLHFWFRSHAS